MDKRINQRSTLQICVEELRRRRQAISGVQEGDTYYAEDLAIFLHYARQANLICPAPEEVNLTPDDEGNEHQVWFRKRSNTFLKITWLNFFGMKVLHRVHEERKASPIDYLERWSLHNEFFGDTVEFIGVLEDQNGIRLVIEQQAILGTPASDDSIRNFFTSNQWLPFIIENQQAFFDPKHDIVISDTHRGNLVQLPNGLLAPIDLRVQRVHGSLRNAVRNLCLP